jgi:bifunctional non-homologous end joining protein LigD
MLIWQFQVLRNREAAAFHINQRTTPGSCNIRNVIIMGTTLSLQVRTTDKSSPIQIQESNGEGVRRFDCGNMGDVINVGPTPPVPFDSTQPDCSKLIREKLNMGCKHSAEVVTCGDGRRRMAAVRPQLLFPVDDVKPLLSDNAFYMQPKHDGKRLLIHKNGQDVTGFNRHGIECGIPANIRTAAHALRGDFLVDGEAVGDMLHTFDLLELDSCDIRPIFYRDRLVKLLNLLASGQQSGIRWVATISGPTAKQMVFRQLRKAGAEGVVFKRIRAPYSPERPESGGDYFKYKFVEAASETHAKKW